jgi:para-nitrobenzyl esterase
MKSRWSWMLVLLLSAPAAAAGPSVRVEEGLLSGATTRSGVAVYRGIPYAAPPVGPLRWRPPNPAARWDGVRRADAFGPSAIQTIHPAMLPWTEEYLASGPVSEDCLTLNVWAPGGTKRPVLVYIHGGGFVEGSGALPIYDGERLAREGIVVVTINYRLGALGFMAHPELTRESEHHASGNYGLLDQIAALRWVQKNVASFGGDPSRVTVAGQSAGAASVHALMASPLARGLFERAIVQSTSGVVGFGAKPLASAETSGVEFAASKGATTLAELRTLDASTLAGGQLWLVVDGWSLPENPDTAPRADVPVLTGFTADENSFIPQIYGGMSAEKYRELARQVYGDLADEVLRLYPAGTDAEAKRSQVESARDRGRVSMYLWAEARAKRSKTPAYTYYFDRAIPWPAHPEFGAFHGAEIPYVFGTLDRLDRPWTAADRTLSEQMVGYWARFVKAGDPNGAGAPRWPRFDPGSPTTMRLGETAGPRPVADAERLALWRKYFASAKSRENGFMF